MQENLGFQWKTQTRKHEEKKKTQPKFPEFTSLKDPDNTNSSEDDKEPQTTAIHQPGKSVDFEVPSQDPEIMNLPGSSAQNERVGASGCQAVDHSRALSN